MAILKKVDINENIEEPTSRQMEFLWQLNLRLLKHNDHFLNQELQIDTKQQAISLIDQAIAKLDRYKQMERVQ